MPITSLAENFIESNNNDDYKLQIELAVDALEEVRNFGSQIFVSKHKNATLDYPFLVQIFYLRKLLEIIDNVSILIKAQSSPEPLLRTLFECVVYISHIMEKETVNRALSFVYVTTIENEIKNDKFNPNTLMGKETKAALSKEHKENMLDPFIEFIEKTNTGLLTIRANKEFKVIEKEYKRVKETMNSGSRKNQRPPWYYLFGGSKSFKDLCDRLGYQGRYKIIFDQLSEVVHAQDIIQKIEIIDDIKIQYPLFRRYPDYITAVNTVFILSHKIFGLYLKGIEGLETDLNRWALQYSAKYNKVLHK